MADIGPGQFPTTPSFVSVNFKLNTPTITSETNSGKVRRVGYGHSYYTFDVKYPSITNSQLGEVMGFVATAQGSLFSFEIVLPEISTSKAADSTYANSTATLSSTASFGQKYALLSNCGANNDILKAGDFIRFDNHSKVYMVTQDVSSDGAGTANLRFSGSLVTSVPSGTKLWCNGVPFTVILTGPEQSFDMGFGGISSLSLSMREIW